MKKPTAVVTSDQPFFDPGTGSSMMSVSQPAEVFTGVSPVQATRDVTATQPGEAPSMMRESAATMTATLPVDSPGARMATQPIEAPGARSDGHSQPTGTGSGDGSAVDRSLTSSRTVAADNTGECDIEDELCSELASPDVASDREVSLKKPSTERQ